MRYRYVRYQLLYMYQTLCKDFSLLSVLVSIIILHVSYELFRWFYRGAPICNTVLQHFSCNMVLAGCCCQLVCFEFDVLHFRLPPVYPKRAGWRTRTLVVVFGFGPGWLLLSIVCFEFVVLHFRMPIPETQNGQIIEHVRTEKEQKRPCPAVQGTWLQVGPFLAGVLTQRFSTQPLELYIPRLPRCTTQ